jgi:hypothetical protein
MKHVDSFLIIVNLQQLSYQSICLTEVVFKELCYGVFLSVVKP